MKTSIKMTKEKKSGKQIYNSLPLTGNQSSPHKGVLRALYNTALCNVP